MDSVIRSFDVRVNLFHLQLFSCHEDSAQIAELAGTDGGQKKQPLAAMTMRAIEQLH
jgi:hypothetical protein